MIVIWNIYSKLMWIESRRMRVALVYLFHNSHSKFGISNIENTSYLLVLIKMW